MTQRLRAAALTLLILALTLGAWQIAATPREGAQTVDAEYAALVGTPASQGQKSSMPRPSDVAIRAWVLLRDPFYIHGTNDQGSASNSAGRCCACCWASAWLCSSPFHWAS